MYLGLLAGALAFCWQNLRDYFEGATDYSTTQEPLTLSDMPSLTFCWRLWGEPSYNHKPFPDERGLTYDKQFIIDMKVQSKNDQSVITLLEDTFIATQFGFEVHLSELHLRHTDSELKYVDSKFGQQGSMLDKQCYKIRTMMTKQKQMDFQNFEVQLAFRFLDELDYMVVMATSQ